MDVGTGEILEFNNQKELEAAQAVRDLVELKGKPKKSCRKCYGRGYIGFNTTTGKYIVCGCVKKEKVVAPDPEVEIAALQARVERLAAEQEIPE